MIKLKAKSIENIAERAKERTLGHLSEDAKVGIIVCCDNFSAAANYSLKMAEFLEAEINKLGLNTEIITLPALNDRYKTYTTESYLIDIYKDQMQNLTELILTEKSYDGVVIIGKGISAAAGMLMGAICANIPTLVLTEGASPDTTGHNLKTLTDMVGQIAAGTKSTFDIQNAENEQAELIGDGANFNTMNLFSVILEGLGLSILGASASFAGSTARLAVVSNTAKAMADLVNDRTNIKKLLNKKVIQNALIVNYALGGSTNILKILLDIAKFADADINLDKALAMVKNVPVLMDTYKTSMAQFIKINGTASVLKQLLNKALIDGSVKMYNGLTLAENLKNIKAKDECNIPLRKEALIALKGNVAEYLSLVKTINIPAAMQKFEGTALVYNDDSTASGAVLSKGVKDGTVMVIKNCGTISGGGQNSVSETASAISSMNKTDKIVILTDGTICDNTNTVIIGEVRPESESGNIKYLQDGDKIEIDFVKGRINTDLSAKDFKLREKKYGNDHKAQPNFVKNYLKTKSM